MVFEEIHTTSVPVRCASLKGTRCVAVAFVVSDKLPSSWRVSVGGGFFWLLCLSVAFGVAISFDLGINLGEFKNIWLSISMKLEGQKTRKLWRSCA